VRFVNSVPRRRAGVVVSLALACAGSCVGYQAAPLDPTAELGELLARATRRPDPVPPGPWPAAWFPLVGDVDLGDGLTLGEANALALLHAPAIVAARREAQVAGAQVLQAGLWRNPELFVGPRISTENSDLIFPAGLSWELPLWGVETGERDAATARRSAAELRALEVELATLGAVRELYARLASLREREAIATAGAEANERIVGWVEALRGAGGVDAVSAFLALAERDDSRLELEVVRTEHAAARRELHALLGLLPNAPVEPVLDPTALALPELAPADHAALLRHPALQAAEADYAVAEANLRREVARQYPEIRFGLEYESDRGEGHRRLRPRCPAAVVRPESRRHRGRRNRADRGARPLPRGAARRGPRGGQRARRARGRRAPARVAQRRSGSRRGPGGAGARRSPRGGPGRGGGGVERATRDRADARARGRAAGTRRARASARGDRGWTDLATTRGEPSRGGTAMKTTWIDVGLACGAALFLFVCAGCSREEPSGDPAPQGQTSTPTNRLQVPPEVVNNLGITFESATRGKLGVWRSIPGRLEVPEGKRFTLRSPAAARVLTTAARWQRVQAGDVLATLSSPDVPQIQRALALATANGTRAEQELAAAGARLGESKGHARDTAAFAQASRTRLTDIEAQPAAGNALLAREVFESRRTVADTARSALDAAILRDELAAKVSGKQIERDQALLAVAEELQRLATLTGLPVDELARQNGDTPGWRSLTALAVRAPASGIVVEVHASVGETTETGGPLLELIDPSELRFRGHIPEADLAEFAAGNPVRIELPGRENAAIDAVLGAPLPLADPTTRMILVEAAVPANSGTLAHGLSAVAHVRVREGANDEVLLSPRCIVQDGMETIVFRRDRTDPNVVIRTPIEVGARARHQVEVLSGLADNDTVVADGVHQLKQTGLGKAPPGVHFHADGTWHAEHK
jgi:hypothetical protein